MSIPIRNVQVVLISLLVSLTSFNVAAESYRIDFEARIDRVGLPTGKAEADQLIPGTTTNGRIVLSPTEAFNPHSDNPDFTIYPDLVKNLSIAAPLNVSFIGGGAFLSNGTLTISIKSGCYRLVASTGERVSCTADGDLVTADASKSEAKSYSAQTFLLAQSGHLKSTGARSLGDTVTSMIELVNNGATKMLLSFAEPTTKERAKVIMTITSMKLGDK